MKIAVIGAGIIGSLIAREFTKYKVEIEIFEKLPDVGWGVTKANSGILHAGYDDEPGTLRAKYCSRGNEMYANLSEELNFEIKRTGSLVVAFNDKEIKVVEELLKRGKINGVKGLRILSRLDALEIEPNLSRKVVTALYSPNAGVIAPWEVAQAAVENALNNGAKVHLSTKVKSVFKEGERYKLSTSKGIFLFDVVVNAAGLWADELAESAGVKVTPLHPRRGQYILLDQPNVVRTVVFPTPSKAGKGILVLPTVHNTTLLGPTSEDLLPTEKEATETTAEGLSRVVEKAKKLVPLVNLSKTIRTFAGLRPENDIKDFVIKRESNMIHIVATRSPGLTAAPAIAKDIVGEIVEKMKLQKRDDFHPIREAIPKITDMSDEEKERLISQNPSYGRVICRCNKVTEGEIVEAIRHGAKTLDGVKFRTTAMFGRCQGSFCMVKIMNIMKRELGKDFEGIVKNFPKSNVVDGVVR